ncbi:phage terminase large subunit family protein [Yoonia sp. I 8.24]|uniref:phage terminase large subunit family protein n=1 Tax=Yoonia sp. I 8.24 TaxID=1537229 RepID=UPI001EE13A91|nr:terminase gpA endonuclease subunit [Yoonia sp. I 8.24]MCG3266102.1 phage terminase large subunit family protein [Yoonia sp. I 8.24]
MLDIAVTSAEWMAGDVLAEILNPPPPVDYLKWAEDNIVFSERESEFSGPYNRQRFRYFDEILRALSPDDPCRIVSLSKSAQLGGTVLANIFTGGSMDMDPGDFLYVHPTHDNAVRWSKMKLSPMLKGTTALRKIFPMKARDGQDSVTYKERRDGRGALLISGANSPASLSQVSINRQVQDDLAKWDMNSAGDPENQADSRSQGREFAKIFKISTPMVVPGCRITSSFEAGSQEYPYVPCPHCGFMQVLAWENMLQNLDEDHPERAHFTCQGPDCGCAIQDHHRAEIIPLVEWRASNPKQKRYHRSFYLWSAYSPLQSFERIARAWLAAKGDPPKEQTFWNDVVGKAYRVLGESPPWEDLRDRASESDYVHGTIPAGYPLLTCGVDCQGDRVEWQVVAWGTNRRRAVVEYGVFNGHISDEARQTKLNGLLKQGFRNAYGRKIEIDLLAIDGNAYTEDVWDWARKHPAGRVIMVRGVHPESAPLLAQVKKERNRRGKLVRYSKRFFNFASSVLKMALYRNLKKDDPEERGFVALPKGLEDEYFRQLTSESRKAQKAKSGFTRYLWVKDPSQANEGLDTHLQAEAAATRLGVRSLPDTEWDKLMAARECPPEDVQADFEDLLMVTRPTAAEAPEEAVKSERAKDRARRKWSKK